MPEINHYSVIEHTKKAIEETQNLTTTKDKNVKATNALSTVKELFQKICENLGYTDEEYYAADEDIGNKVDAHIKKKRTDKKEEIKADDQEKLALAETLAAIARALMTNWDSKSAIEKQAALDQIKALQAQIADISGIASDNVKEEIEGITAGVNTELAKLDNTSEDPDDSSALSLDDEADATSSRASVTGGKDSDPLNKPDAQYTLFSDTTGVRMGVTVKDGKTKIRIPHTEGLSQDEKVRLAKSFVEAALLEGAYKLENGIPTFTLTTPDIQFREAVKAQIELLGFNCKLPKGHEIPEGKITKQVREYNEEVLGEHMPGHTFTDKKEEKKYLANRPTNDFQIALFNSLATPKTEERAEADMKAAAPSSLLKYLYHNRAETGALRVAKFRSGSANTVSPADIAEAAESVKKGFLVANYTDHSSTDLSDHLERLKVMVEIDEPLEPAKLKQILADFSRFSVERAKAAAAPKPGQAPSQS